MCKNVLDSRRTLNNMQLYRYADTVAIVDADADTCSLRTQSFK